MVAMEVEVEAMEEVDMAEGADMKTNVNTVSGVCYVVKSTLDISVVLLRPPPSTRSRGGLSQISDLIDIDYETLVLLLGVAGAGLGELGEGLGESAQTTPRKIRLASGIPTIGT